MKLFRALMKGLGRTSFAAAEVAESQVEGLWPLMTIFCALMRPLKRSSSNLFLLACDDVSTYGQLQQSRLLWTACFETSLVIMRMRRLR